MRNMKIGVKMTLWFAAFALLIVCVCFGALYASTSALLEQMLRDNLAFAVRQISAQVERESGALIYENETPIASEISYYIVEENGSELFSHGEDITLFDDEPFHEGEYTRLTRYGEEWMVLDSEPIAVASGVIRVRTAIRCTSNQRMLTVMRRVFLLSVPPLILLAALAGFILTWRSLAPIRAIISSAQRIERGDLSERIPPAPAEDELGKLTVTLNEMITSLESAFRREQRFSSDASHELRTPVAVIRAYAENLRDQPDLNTEAKASAQTILQECLRMQKLIEQMLALTRAQEGRYELHPERLCLADVFEGVQSAMVEPASEKQITMTCAVQDDLFVSADQSLLTQLLINLAENAIKYGKPNGHIALRAYAEGADIRLIVEDDGIGIDSTDLPHIFERFFRADTARNRSGCGLGLSIAQWIVQVHGGSMDVQSAPGKGTAFLIRWPGSIPREAGPTSFEGSSDRT